MSDVLEVRISTASWMVSQTGIAEDICWFLLKYFSMTGSACRDWLSLPWSWLARKPDMLLIGLGNPLHLE